MRPNKAQVRQKQRGWLLSVDRIVYCDLEHVDNKDRFEVWLEAMFIRKY